MVAQRPRQEFAKLEAARPFSPDTTWTRYVRHANERKFKVTINHESRVRASQQRAREAMNLARKERTKTDRWLKEFRTTNPEMAAALKRRFQPITKFKGAVVAAYASRHSVVIWISSPTGDSSDSHQVEIPAHNEAHAKFIAAAWRALWEIPEYGTPEGRDENLSSDDCEECGAVSHLGGCYNG